MARANLALASELQAAFKAALDGSVRCIQAAIKDETIVYTKSIKVSSATAEKDFADIVSSLDAKTPIYLIFNGDSAAGKWSLISYVPEYSNVRMKMLYSSSRDDVKKSLGSNLFYNDFQATEKGDLTWAAYSESKSNARSQGPLTLREEIRREEAMSSKSSAPSSAIASVAFTFEAALSDKIAAFSSGSVNWVEIRVNTEKEISELGKAGTESADSMIAAVNASEPRFYLAKPGDSTFFVYCCPDEAKVRERMMYSSCKANIIDNVKKAGIEIGRAVEIREPSDLNDEFSGVVVDATLGSSAVSFSKPTKPGKRTPPSKKK